MAYDVLARFNPPPGSTVWQFGTAAKQGRLPRYDLAAACMVLGHKHVTFEDTVLISAPGLTRCELLHQVQRELPKQKSPESKYTKQHRSLLFIHILGSSCKPETAWARFLAHYSSTIDQKFVRQEVKEALCKSNKLPVPSLIATGAIAKDATIFRCYGTVSLSGSNYYVKSNGLFAMPVFDDETLSEEQRNAVVLIVDPELNHAIIMLSNISETEKASEVNVKHELKYDGTRGYHLAVMSLHKIKQVCVRLCGFVRMHVCVCACIMSWRVFDQYNTEQTTQGAKLCLKKADTANAYKISLKVER